MKKLIFFLLGMILSVAAMAQTVTLPTMAAAAQNVNATYQLVTTDYTLSAATVRNFIFTAPQHYPTTQDYAINLDTIVGTNHTSIAVALYGQKSTLKGDWTAIGSAVTWTLGINNAADTTIVISNSTAARYRNYKVTVTGVGTGAVTKIDAQELKLYLE